MRKKLLASAAMVLLPGFATASSFADDPKPSRPNAEELRKIHGEHCLNRSARVAGDVAYLETRLKLTDAQRAAWTKWHDIALANAKSEERQCLAMPPRPAKADGPPSIVERRAFMQKMLAAKLETLETSQPALEALYRVLDDDQKDVLDRGGEFDGLPGFEGRPRHGFMRVMASGPRMMMGRGGPDDFGCPDAPPIEQ